MIRDNLMSFLLLQSCRSMACVALVQHAVAVLGHMGSNGQKHVSQVKSMFHVVPVPASPAASQAPSLMLGCRKVEMSLYLLPQAISCLHRSDEQAQHVRTENCISIPCRGCRWAALTGEASR